MATTARAGEKIYEWDRHPRMPMPAPPAGSCDCQFHIYGDPAQFRRAPTRPIRRSKARLLRRRGACTKRSSFARGVIVHSAIYGSDHRLSPAARARRTRRSGALSGHRHTRRPSV